MSFLSRVLGTERPAIAHDRVEPRAQLPTVTKNDAVTSTMGGRGWPQPMLYAALGGYASNTGVPVTPFTAMQAAAVYACVKIISQDIALLRPFIRRTLVTGKFRIERQHPLLKLFRNPNRWQTWTEFISYWVSSICLRGNGYAVVERDMDGNAIELVPVAPDRVSIQLSVDGLMFYRVNSRRIGMGIVVPPDDMMHLKNISMDGYVGVSPIAIAQDVIGLALAAQQHGGILFRQGGQIGGLISHPGQLSKEARDRIAGSWRETHEGVQNAHKIAVLEEGMKFEKIAMTSEDAQLLECVAAGTLVTLANGALVPVEEIKSGCPIMSWQNGEPVISKVSAVGQPPKKPMVRITTNRGRTLTCTTDHPCLVQEVARSLSGRNGVNDEPSWVRAGDLRVGNFIRVALGHTAQDQGELSPNEAWLLGFVTGDGYLRRGGCSLSLGYDNGVIAAATESVRALGGSLTQSNTNPADWNVNTGGLGCKGGYIRQLFNRSGLVGLHSHDKRVPLIVQRDGPTSWAWFLSGYLDADGTVAPHGSNKGVKQGQVVFASVNRELLADCQHILALLGVQSAIYPFAPEANRMMPNGKVSAARAGWGLSVSGRRMLARTAAILRPYHSTKSMRLAAFVDLGASRYGPFTWHYDQITEVEPVGEGESYAIEIEGTHTHVTNGLVTHNTRRFQVNDICRLYSVPPHKLGELDKATLNNIEQQQQQYIDAALTPISRRIEELFDRHLLFDDERSILGCKLDADELTRGDMMTRYQAYQIGTLNGWLSRNEVRCKENMDPVDGGDEYRVPLNTGDPLHPQTIAQAKPPSPGPGTEPDDADGDDD